MLTGPVGAADLIGTWRLVGWEIRYASGRVSRPFGADPVGLLVYAPDGGMNVAIAVRQRPPLSRADVRRAPAAEQAAAFATYFSYGGRYAVADGQVTHAVEVALNPAYVGTRQVRSIDLADEALALSTVESGPGGERTHVLSWRRPQGAGGPGANSGSSHQG